MLSLGKFILCQKLVENAGRGEMKTCSSANTCPYVAMQHCMTFGLRWHLWLKHAECVCESRSVRTGNRKALIRQLAPTGYDRGGNVKHCLTIPERLRRVLPTKSTARTFEASSACMQVHCTASRDQGEISSRVLLADHEQVARGARSSSSSCAVA